MSEVGFWAINGYPCGIFHIIPKFRQSWSAGGLYSFVIFSILGNLLVFWQLNLYNNKQLQVVIKAEK